MQIVNILVLATVALVLLGGLVALGVGHRRWSIGTVVAGFLVLVSAATFLSLAARLAERDRVWKTKIDDYESRLAKAEDDRMPGPGTRGWQKGPDSLDRLRERRDRWQRGLDRIQTWRGRVWINASFKAPKDDASSGRVELAERSDTADSPPIAPGSLVFLFDSASFEDGGEYIGEFRVDGTSVDEATKRHVLSVVETAPRDEYDTTVLAKPHDEVIVFEDLPIDRWLAFYRSVQPDAAPADGAVPRTEKQDADAVRTLLAGRPDVAALVAQFVESFRQHEENVPKDEWTRAEHEAGEHPGTLWAEVSFTKSFSFGGAGAPPPATPEADATTAEGGPEPPEAAASEPDYAPGARAVFDLQTAVELRDRDHAVTIERVFRRRPLTDPMMVLHGGAMAGEDVGPTTGNPAMWRMLRDEIASLDRSNEQLRTAREAAVANTEDERKVAGELGRDLGSWKRDVGAAGDLVAALERERARVATARQESEAAIVADGRELTAALDRLAREIDLVAPPPERRAARP